MRHLDEGIVDSACEKIVTVVVYFCCERLPYEGYEWEFP